jgi:hypothetical protein
MADFSIAPPAVTHPNIVAKMRAAPPLESLTRPLPFGECNGSPSCARFTHAARLPILLLARSGRRTSNGWRCIRR